MEQPPGSLDDLQPQDLSTSSLPTVIDLTRNGEDCVLNSTSLNALQMVKSPGWYPNTGASNPGLPLSETGTSDSTLQSRDGPDNAFSHTTVTLSYVSRSHVFSAHDSLSQRSPVYGVPPISKFSVHSPCDSDEGLGDTGYALNQHYLVGGPLELASTQRELFQSLSQAQMRPENECLTNEPQELNGGVIYSDKDVDKRVIGEEENGLFWKKNGGLENGQDDSFSSSGVCAEPSPETLTPATGEDVLFLMSKKQDTAVVPDRVGATRDLYSLSREYISPLEDPVSPSATSLDNVEDVLILPQASSSPSGDNSYLETTDEEVAWDGLRTKGATEPGSGINNGLDSSAENRQPVHRRKAVLEPLIDLTDDLCVSDVSGNKPKTAIPHMNGNAKALQRTLKEKKLPARSGRGTRLEAIVMNINSSRYKVSGCIRTNKKAKASQSTARDSASPKRSDTLSVEKRKSRAKVKTMKQKAVTSIKMDKTKNIKTCKVSTSDSEINHSKKSNGSTCPKRPQFVHKKSNKVQEDVSHPAHSRQVSPVNSKRKPSSKSSPQYVHKTPKEPEHLFYPDPLMDIPMARFPPPPPPPPLSKSPKKSQGKAKRKATGSRTSPTAKTKGAGTFKRRQKKPKWSQVPSMFSPKEPEIKLKYVNYKEEKRDFRLDSFSPFVRVKHQQLTSSLCTVINYPEEVRTPQKKGQHPQAHPCGFSSAVVPCTSCLQLGRASTDSQHQRAFVCCLCGQAANAMDLGDLHGPYYPEGYQPSTKRPAGVLGLKEDEDDYSNSDSSSSWSIRGRGRKCANPPVPRALRPGAHLKQKGLLKSQRWTADNTGSPAAKRARSDADSVDVEDWYSPPVLPLDPCEYWLHEDCGIWSAGVFLVKGKVYGLEEAVKVAQETMCTACSDPGATLGCFFKVCPNKYHYRCALESADCVLIEENLSMKCKKHKNKTLKAPPGNRWDDR
ncbi:transcription factor 20 isoform X1 [Etheostoma cragini]|uniref:transcription factor 20 isoform X1 n=1 Tax=Etheostoma cragini TaxID=417921 RepID=UPI00155F3460|nr:transcription factor 20 isoform X1 [Etheostoma cragini]XP_034717223.1 transcription factor 20 isoform X1 [Etheostoma cragini]